MTYSNPLQMLMQMGQMAQGQMQNPLQQMMQMGNPQQFSNPMAAQNKQPINHEQFIQGAMNFDKQTLASLVNQARAQGIQETDIEQGLNFLLNLRK